MIRVGGLVWAALAFCAVPSEAQEVSWFGGASYATGSYIFDARSNTFTVSNGARVRWGQVDVAASIPFMVYDGGLLTSLGDGTQLPTGGSQHERVSGRQSGETIGTRRGRSMPPSGQDSALVFDEAYTAVLGDPYVSANARILTGTGGFRSLSVSGSAKVPVSDPDSGVGSGAWDFGLGASAIVGVGRTLLLTDLTYRWLGDLADLELLDGVAWTVGASRPIGSGSASILVALSGMSSAIDGVEAPLSLLASLGRTLGARGFATAGFGLGLSESAADVSLSLGWSLRLGG